MREIPLAAVTDSLTADELSIDRADVIFGQQDSGCTSWGVAAAGERWFVKRAETDAARSMLTSALRFHGLISHEAIVRPLRVFDADAFMLV